MRRAVFPETDGVMGVDEDRADLHERRHAQGVTGILGEHQEGGAVGDEAAVQGDAVHDGRHAELAHTIIDIVAVGHGVAHALRAFPDREIGTGQVGGTTEEFRQHRAVTVQRVLRGLARGDGLGLGVHGLDEFFCFGVPVLRQLALHAPLELGGQVREGLPVGGKLFVPMLLGFGALGLGIPAGVDFRRDHERRVVPAQVLAGCGDLGLAQRGAVAIVRTAEIRRAVADDGLAADHARLVILRTRLEDRLPDGLGVMAVDVAHHVPAVGLETLRRVVGEPALDVPVDRDAVVVVKRNQFAEAERAGERAGLVRDAFHQAAVAEEYISIVIDDVMAVAVELTGQRLLGDRHAHGIGDALAQRTGGGLNARGIAVLRMTRGLGMQLAEVLELLHRQVVAGEMQERIDEHRAVAVRQHETVAIHPLRVAWVVLEEIVPQHLGDVGHAHGSPGMSGVRLLHRVHRECADGVRQLAPIG